MKKIGKKELKQAFKDTINVFFILGLVAIMVFVIGLAFVTLSHAHPMASIPCLILFALGFAFCVNLFID